MTTKLEIERKFLVKFPSSWSDLAELFDGIHDVKRISQTYLVPEKESQQLVLEKLSKDYLERLILSIISIRKSLPVIPALMKKQNMRFQKKNINLLSKKLILANVQWKRPVLFLIGTNSDLS